MHIQPNIIHHVYAILNDDDVIKDIIYANSFEEASIIAKNSFIYGKAFCIDDYPVQVDDFYISKKFYHRIEDGTFIEVQRVLNEDDRIRDLEDIINQKNRTISYLEAKLKGL